MMTITKKKRIIILIATLLVIGIGAWYWYSHRSVVNNQITIYGDMDIREEQAAFNDNGRILNILVQEGDQVKKSQLLAELDPVRFQDSVARDQATVASQEQVLARLLAGSRPEEIAEARAEVAAAQATLNNAEITWQRQQALNRQQYIPKQSLDNAVAAQQTARANLQHAQQALSLAIKGPRKEDIAAARQQLQAERAALALTQRLLADTKLYAPEDGEVQDRILEPGDMVTPQSPVFTLALNNPVWARAYLPEQALGQIRLGMQAWIRSDSFPGQRFPGWVGYISPTAEFTPKSVETTELRTELMYRVRIYACNQEHRLRLGMPVSVDILLKDNPPRAWGARPCGN